MSDGQIAIVAVAALAYLVLSALILWPKAGVDAERGEIALQHGGLLRGLGLFFSVVPAAIVVLAFVTQAKGEDIYAILGLLVFMTILDSLLLLEAFRARLVISSEGVRQESPWRGRHYLRWNEIVEMQYSEMNHWFLLLGTDGRKIRASTYLNGIIALIRAVRVHLPKVRYENAYRGIEIVDKSESVPDLPRRRLDKLN